MADGSKQRASGYTAVAGLLSHPDTTRFISSVEAFIARRGRRNALPGTELRRLTEPASSFAAECLERLRRRVMKRGKAMLDLPREQRHDRRIALKNLLYTADFFGDLFGHGSTVTSYTKVAARLQDALGSFNNMVMVIDQVARLDTSSSQCD
jgi:triphosphatase